MTRKAVALEAYIAGQSARSAALTAGLRPSGYVRRLIKMAGISRPVGRPRKFLKGERGQAQQAPAPFQ